MVSSGQFHHHRAAKKERHDNVFRKHLKTRISIDSFSAFQKKYTVLLLTSIFGSVAFFMTVLFYNSVSNYSLFKKLAFNSNPELVEHLERELLGVYCLYGAGLITIFFLCLIIGFRITKSVATTIQKMQRHFDRVSNGDFSHHEIRYSIHEDHSDLLISYAKFYRNSRKQLQTELEELESIKNHIQDEHIKNRINEFCSFKKKQLGIKTSAASSDISEKPRASRGQRRAS